jgi:hypothetical protein
MTASAWIGFLVIGSGFVIHAESYLPLLVDPTEGTVLLSVKRFQAFVTSGSKVLYRMMPDWKKMSQLDNRGFLIVMDIT